MKNSVIGPSTVFRLGLTIFLAVVWCGLAGAQEEERGHPGGLALPDSVYQSYLRQFEKQGAESQAVLPSDFDWRDSGAVTPAKNQRNCECCWAFATTGALESKIIINAGKEYDLSEQMIISGPNMELGCCGGHVTAAAFYFHQSPRQEACYPYGDGNFSEIHKGGCPPFSDIAANRMCPPVCFNVTDLYTVDVGRLEDVKQSVLTDGPAVVLYGMYQDFYTYWNSPLGTAPWTDGVYFHQDGAADGNHVVLCFGWDDEDDAYLMKNSWGDTEGPFGNGTFRIRTDQILEMSNFSVLPGVCDGYDIRLCSLGTRQTVSPLCLSGQTLLEIKATVRTRYPGRVTLGWWKAAITNASGASSSVTREIRNGGDFMDWSETTRTLTVRECIGFDKGQDWQDFEYWIWDAERVESSHKTVRVYRKKWLPQCGAVPGEGGPSFVMVLYLLPFVSIVCRKGMRRLGWKRRQCS